MVEPSSGITSLGGDLQPLDDDKELVKNQTSLEDLDSTANVDSYKKDSPEAGSPEKLNLDRSSGDESMEEDVAEIKQVESNMKSDDLGGNNELNSGDVKEVILPDSVVEPSKEVIAEEKSAASAEKRKLEGLFLSLQVLLFFLLDFPLTYLNYILQFLTLPSAPSTHNSVCMLYSFTWHKVPILSHNPYNSSEHANVAHMFILVALL
jgi:hypothetical protein